MKLCWLLLSLVFFTRFCSALEVLGVVGPVVPAEPYYEHLISKAQIDPTVQVEPVKGNRMKHWTGEFEYDSGLTSGRFDSYTLEPNASSKVVQPLCLVADDDQSKRWLSKTRTVLKEVNAVCYLVKSGSESDLARLRQHYSDLRIYALDPSILITTFGVPHYPALIFSRGVEQ